MKQSTNITGGFKITMALLLAVSLFHVSPIANASGGSKSGGGGSSKVVEARVTGYVTAIDYENSTITIGASYYGTGEFHVTSSTSISFNNVSCELDDLEVGDWVEARYEYASRIATKLSATGIPQS